MLLSLADIFMTLYCHTCTLGNATRVPEKSGTPDHFQIRKPGFESEQKPGFMDLILGANR